MSVEKWILVVGITISIVNIVGVVWLLRKSAQEKRASRSHRPVGRTLSEEELRFPFGRPPAARPHGSSTVRNLRPMAAAIPTAATQRELDVDLDAIEGVVHVVRDVVQGDPATEESVCRRSAEVDATGEPIEPKGHETTCHTDAPAEPVDRDGESGGGAIETTSGDMDKTSD